MKKRIWMHWGLAVVLLGGGNGWAAEISGTITSTLMISEDSWLVGNVTCRVQGAPCITAASSNITLWLSGYSMTGLADPPSGCPAAGEASGAEHGIAVVGQRRVEVFGPGLVQRFRGQGLLLGAGTTRARVKDVTFSTNCWSGILINGSDNDVEENLYVRNGRLLNPCGGICITNGNFNRIRKNFTSGNGLTGEIVNFGIGLLGTSRGNVIQGNNVVGNVNGIFLQPNTMDNLILNNVVGGNPPIPVVLSLPAFMGFDVRNQAPEGANTFHDNLCETYSGAGRAPCPNIRVVER